MADMAGRAELGRRRRLGRELERGKLQQLERRFVVRTVQLLDRRRRLLDRRRRGLEQLRLELVRLFERLESGHFGGKRMVGTDVGRGVCTRRGIVERHGVGPGLFILVGRLGRVQSGLGWVGRMVFMGESRLVHDVERVVAELVLESVELVRADVV